MCPAIPHNKPKNLEKKKKEEMTDSFFDLFLSFGTLNLGFLLCSDSSFRILCTMKDKMFWSSVTSQKKYQFPKTQFTKK